jgi:ABC-type nickel/cobalt efflux system permease component RcnA
MEKGEEKGEWTMEKGEEKGEGTWGKGWAFWLNIGILPCVLYVLSIVLWWRAVWVAAGRGGVWADRCLR